MRIDLARDRNSGVTSIVAAAPADATAEEVDGACAEAAAVMPQLADLQARADLLGRLASQLAGHADEVIAVARYETALAEPRLRAELDRTVRQLESFAAAVAAGQILEAVITTGDSSDRLPPRPDLRRFGVPVGPVAVFAASNFPLAFSVLGGDTASAVAAGCPVVVKAHPGHPRLSALVGAIAEQAAGRGIIHVIYGMAAGLELIGHPDIRAAAFTGSATGARALATRIAARTDPIPFYAELGSLNPVVVTRAAAEADGSAIIRGLAASYTQSAGQLCTKPGLVFIPSGLGLADVLDVELQAARPAPMLTAEIRDRFLTQVTVLAGHGDVRSIRRPAEADQTGVAPVALLVRAPTVPDDVLEECFGPVTTLVEYDDLGQVSSVLARLNGSLTGTLHIGPQDAVVDLRPIIDQLTMLCGRVIFGGWPTGVTVAPAMQHGGPWPVSTDSLHTSVGPLAARRFLRPVCFQDAPDGLLPAALQDANPLRIMRCIDGNPTRDQIQRSNRAGVDSRPAGS